jgi:hypothetical protein
LESSKKTRFKKGQVGNRLGSKHTEETRLKMSRTRKGRKLSPEHIEKLKLSRVGKHPWNWIENRTKALEKKRVRSSTKWVEWRREVFKRDEYTCQECGIIGVYLEAHHIVPVRSCGDELLFDTRNGITLCRPCHSKTMWKESSFEERYSAKVAARAQHYFWKSDGFDKAEVGFEGRD